MLNKENLLLLLIYNPETVSTLILVSTETRARASRKILSGCTEAQHGATIHRDSRTAREVNVHTYLPNLTTSPTARLNVDDLRLLKRCRASFFALSVDVKQTVAEQCEQTRADKAVPSVEKHNVPDPDLGNTPYQICCADRALLRRSLRGFQHLYQTSSAELRPRSNGYQWQNGRQ